MTTHRNFGLDLLRAIAISMVVASHLHRLIISRYEADLLVGAFGVELFFVLSGFLIGGILIRSVCGQERFTARNMVDFWMRRWFRTLPNYYWTILLCLIFAPPSVAIWSYLVLMQNFAWPFKLQFLGTSWSLAVEEWFYLLFPAALFFLSLGCTGRHRLMRKMLITIAVFTVVPTTLRFSRMLWLGVADPRMIVVFRIDAIVYGVFLAYLKVNSSLWPALVRAWPLGVLGLSSAVLIVVNATLARSFAFTLLPLSVALILPRVFELRAPKSAFRPVIENISLWSYSIYLLHPLVALPLRSFGYARMTLFWKLATDVPTIAAIIAVSALNYHFFELPITNLRDKFKPFSRPPLPRTIAAGHAE